VFEHVCHNQCNIPSFQSHCSLAVSFIQFQQYGCDKSAGGVGGVGGIGSGNGFQFSIAKFTSQEHSESLQIKFQQGYCKYHITSLLLFLIGKADIL
jgi:hypothetical protein